MNMRKIYPRESKPGNLHGFKNVDNPESPFSPDLLYLVASEHSDMKGQFPWQFPFRQFSKIPASPLPFIPQKSLPRT